MMMAQLRTPGYGTRYKWQARWSWSPVTASSSWRDLWWTLDLDTAEEDYRLRRQMTARWPRAGIIIILRRSYKLWAKAIYGEPGPTQQPAPSLLCLCERLMGQFFKISAKEQSSAP